MISEQDLVQNNKSNDVFDTKIEKAETIITKETTQKQNDPEGLDYGLDNKDLRKININQSEENLLIYGSNYIKTTKYTLISFLPLSLIYQYKRIANIYFLFCLFLSFFPEITPFGPISQLLPTGFVLLVAMLREGLEDFFRHLSDVESNQQPAYKVFGNKKNLQLNLENKDQNSQKLKSDQVSQVECKLQKIKSSDIVTGDVLWIPNDSELAADVLLVSGGNITKQGAQIECFVQTSSLDGEKNLKRKQCPKGLVLQNFSPSQIDQSIELIRDSKGNIEDINQPKQDQLPIVDGLIICELPNKDLHEFHGTLLIDQDAQTKDKKTLQQEQNSLKNFRKFALDEKHILLRGSRLTNTPTGIFGIVVYSGMDTKLMQNQNKKRHKQSKLEVEINKTVAGMLSFLVVACFVITSLSYRWQITEMDNAIYLHKANLIFKNQTTQPKNYPTGTEALPSSAGVWSFIIMFLSALLLYSTFIPVSLIVQFECVKVVQGLWLHSDIELVSVEYEQEQKQIDERSSRKDKYNEKPPKGDRLPISYTPCGVKTWALNEELGQVRIVFSDKTGTLTQNMMEFRLCKIGLEVYGDHNKCEENLGEINESKFDFQKEDKDIILQKSISVSKIDVDSNINLDEIVSQQQDIFKNSNKIKNIENISLESKLSQEAKINLQKIGKSITPMSGYPNNKLQFQNLIGQDQVNQGELKATMNLQSPQQLPLLTEQSGQKDDQFEFQRMMEPIVIEQLGKYDQNKSQSSHRTVSSHHSAVSKRSVANKKQGASYCYKNSDLENLLYGDSPEREDIIVIKDNFSVEIKPFQMFQPINMYSFTGELIFQLKSQKSMSKEFLKCLSTAHECMAKESTDQENPKIHYQGSSPDEVALLEFAQEHGHEFFGANDESISVRRKKKIDGFWQVTKELKFELVRKMEFSSDRKRMSCIIFDQEHQVYKLYCKGADNIIKERLHDCYFDASSDPIYRQTLNETDQFLYQASKQGYRTLLMAMRVLSANEVDDFLTSCKIAESDLINRNSKLEQVYSQYEKDLILLGATVVEDRLQNQVPETISALHQADIKVWVLTGDKLETAESIGFSSKLLTLEMDVIKINSVQEMKALCTREQAFINDFEIKKGKKRALLIEAIALKIVLTNLDNPEDLQLKRWFLKISKTMHTVICCRVSPSQKAEVVRLVRSDDKDLITLAIGDGANDVPMILEANIGIGIYGKEGMRAVDSSDFALAEFRLLWPLLFKQGRFMYQRLSTLVNFFFYKNFIFTLFQLLFGIYNGYSNTSIYADSFLTMYNLLFSSYPITVLSFIDFDVFPSSPEPQDNQNEYSQDPLTYLKSYDPASLRQFIPNLYFPGQRNLSYNQYVFYWWNFRGLIESIILFFITSKIFQESGIMNKYGQPADMWCFSIHIFTCLMIVVHNKNSLLHKKVDITVVLTHLIASWFAYIFFCYCTSQNLDFQQTYTFEITFSSPQFYLTCLICSSVCYIIDLIIHIVSQTYMADTRDLLRTQAIKHKGEITGTFLNDFNKLVSIQKNLAQIEDSFREQELEWHRALKSGLTQQQFIEEQNLTQKQYQFQNDKIEKESLKTTENNSQSQKTFISSIVPTNSPFGLNSYLRPFKSILNRYINIHRQSIYQQVNQNAQHHNNLQNQNIGQNDNPNITINQAPIDLNNVNLEIQQKQNSDPTEKQVLSEKTTVVNQQIKSEKTTVINSSISKSGRNKVHQHQTDQQQKNYEQNYKNSIEFFKKSPDE